ncbi:MAG: pirin family protein [Candidatus Thermoplasmatota archaeon]|nr:pirin family protein [Candidatus Thermoplasmatota archaeon]MCL5730567.1 pirin family protein [Candidatus Thermoplasmatota archaeon]
MKQTRKTVVSSILPAETRDGAGVKLHRVFGGMSTVTMTDPFLLLDHFGSNRIEDYISGFPWHPHRGIETVTYLMEGKVDHEDSVGHRGTIYPGDIQWMTAGSGIFHQEMPAPLNEREPEELLKSTGLTTNVSGFQLWVNISAREKMTKPKYRAMKNGSVPVVDDDGGSMVKIVAGSFEGIQGALRYGTETDPTYLEIRMPEETEFKYYFREGRTAIIYLVTGSISINASEIFSGMRGIILSRSGSEVSIKTGDSPSRFLILSGNPLNEPVYWYGPIVMNTREQIEEALSDLKSGRFVREKEPDFVE